VNSRLSRMAVIAAALMPESRMTSNQLGKGS
jgi:hypothetical protein